MPRVRALLTCGMAMPCIYLFVLTVSCILNPGFDLIHQAPSELGSMNAVYPFVYNLGMVTTATIGFLAAIGLLQSAGIGRGSLWNVWAGVSLVLASTGIAMAGLFPLPNRLHYGFGLTSAAILTPVVGAVSLWRSGRQAAAAVLIIGFFLSIGLVAGTASPLAPGIVMLASIGYLCGNIRDQARKPHR